NEEEALEKLKKYLKENEKPKLEEAKKEAEEKGKPIVHLITVEPDFPSKELLIKALTLAIKFAKEIANIKAAVVLLAHEGSREEAEKEAKEIQEALTKETGIEVIVVGVTPEDGDEEKIQELANEIKNKLSKILHGKEYDP
uniref:Amylin-NHO-18 Binder n=1 Tax=synthetic construct TaxID=32630 RepID=UPI003CE5C96F